jgi:hypothetical protein
VEVVEVRRLEDFETLEQTLALHRKGSSYPSA